MRLWLSRKENIVIIIGSVIAVIAIATPFSILLLTGWNISYKQFNKLGVVGDFFGGTTVGLLSLASIIFVIAAIVMQKEELALQREEVRKTREEYEITNKTMKKQQFENTFFNMITLHNEIVAAVNIGSSNDEKKGRDALQYMYNIFKRHYNNPPAVILDRYLKASNELEKVLIVYNRHFVSNENQLGHYFRNLFRIVKWIDNSDLKFEEKREYIGILRAQLSAYELRYLFYNALSDKGKDFKALLIKYNFFDDHLKSGDLIDLSHFDLLIEDKSSTGQLEDTE